MQSSLCRAPGLSQQRRRACERRQPRWAKGLHMRELIRRADPCPPEELFQVNDDPHQLTNLAKDSKHAKAIEQARDLLVTWTKQTGDSIPDNPTPNRHDPPRIEDGEILPPGKAQTRNPHAEMPGASNNAMKINHPGPLKL